MSLPFEPWHMWGGSIEVQMAAGGAGRLDNIQVANINYKRPDSWIFFFGVELQAAAPAADVDYLVFFDLILGLGRTNIDTIIRPFIGAAQVPFAQFIIRQPVGVPSSGIQFKRWTSTVLSPPLDDSSLTPAATRQPLTSFPAQDIRAQAAVNQVTGGPNHAATLRLTAMFAPRTHLRPDWYTDEGPQFGLGGG